MKWISVDDRLPDNADKGVDDCKTYLCYLNDPYSSGSERYKMCLWINNRWGGFPTGAVKITHWQPLPPPPEAEIHEPS